MPLLDYVSTPKQSVAYLYPELGQADSSQIEPAPNGGFSPNSTIDEVFVFQFWPQQVQDNYTPNYATKTIPGASHPLYQWTGGSGRDISFTANFITELREDAGLDKLDEADFRTRLSASSASSGYDTSAPFRATASPTGIGPLALPSSRYTVNVAAAIAALQRYLYPEIKTSGVKPPRKLILVLPGTRLGRKKGSDGILCILRSASVTMESFFPNGEIRAASVSLRFSETIQRSTGDGQVSQIKSIGSQEYDALARLYQLNGVDTEQSLTLS